MHGLFGHQQQQALKIIQMMFTRIAISRQCSFARTPRGPWLRKMPGPLPVGRLVHRRTLIKGASRGAAGGSGVTSSHGRGKTTIENAQQLSPQTVRDEKRNADLQAVIEMLAGAPSWSLSDLASKEPLGDISERNLEDLSRLAHLCLPSDTNEREALRLDLQRVLGFLGIVHEAARGREGSTTLAPSETFFDGALREDVVAEGDCAEDVLAHTNRRGQGARSSLFSLPRQSR